MAVTFQLFQIPPTPKGEQGIFFEPVHVHKLYIVASHTCTAQQFGTKQAKTKQVLFIEAHSPKGLN